MRLLVAVVLVTVVASGSVRAEIIPICGDADNDGHITVSDGVNALRAAADLPSSCTIAICDVNADDRISIADAVNILRNAAVLPAIDACKDVTAGEPTLTPRPVRTVPGSSD